MKQQIKSFAQGHGVKGVAAVMLLAVSAFAVMPAVADGGRHGGHGHHGGHGGPGMMAFAGSPERVDRMVDRMLKDLDATDAQRAQIKQIARTAAAGIKTQREAGRGLRERAMQLFTQPTVDANAVEALRQQQMSQMDQVSRRMSQAMVDISRVLTPEQRTKLGERMKARAQRWQERSR